MSGHLAPQDWEVLDACAEGAWHVSRGFRQFLPRGMHLAEASELLERMLSMGFLFAMREEDISKCHEVNGSYDYSGAAIYTPAVPEIAASLSASVSIFSVGLTEQGAALWEAAAQPDWGLYIKNWTHEIDDSEETPWDVRMWSRTRARLEDAIRLQWMGRPIPGTEKWQMVSPWRATYWKTLPDGCYVRLLTGGPNSGSMSEEREKWEQTTNWYQRPWNAEDGRGGPCGY